MYEAKINTLDFYRNKNLIFSEVVFNITVEIELHTLDVYMAFQSFEGVIQQAIRIELIRNKKWSLRPCSHLLHQHYWYH